MIATQLLGLLTALCCAPVQAAGTVLPQTPSVAPGGLPTDPPDRLAAARERWYQGDVSGTISVLSPWLEEHQGPYGRERTAGHLLLGLAHMDAGNWNMASTHFYRVRRTEDPLAPWGAWYEAVVDHERGRHTVAISECNQYRERWPEGQHADECLVLIGEAWAAHGHPGAAIGAFQTWLDHNPDTPRTEEIALAKAVAVARTQPQRGIAMLQDLVLGHTFPSTAVGAQQTLDELRQDGHDVTMPSDIGSRKRYAASLRRSGKLVEAWTLFSQLQAEADRMGEDGQPVDPDLQRWVDDSEDLFSWGTRQFDVYVESAVPRYEEAPSARQGWRIYRAFARGGMYEQAAAWGTRMQAEWGERSNRDQVAWAHLHAGAYEEARERFADLGRSGGKTGREARFYAAYGALRSGLYDDAITELGALYDEGGDDAAKAAYWRAKAHDLRGELAEGEQWRSKAVAADPIGWYRMLVETAQWRAAGAIEPAPPASARTATEAWVLRDGRWRGHQPPALASTSPARADPLPAVGQWPATMLLVEAPDLDQEQPRSKRQSLEAPAGNPGWAELSWPPAPRPASIDEDGAAVAAPLLPVSQEELPDGYSACTWYDPELAERTFSNLSARLADLLPELPAAYDLSRAGLSVDAGRILRQTFETWEDAKGRSDPDSLRLQQIGIGDWREMSIFARQAHLSYRLCIGLNKHADSSEDELAAWRLAYPMVRTPELWRHGRTYGVDPFLMMAIMRQESRYQATVVSHAGAIGLVQVMPRTGAKVAALLGEGRYSPAALEDPATNLRYGTYYLSLLLQRFDGAFPLAVASYNGGPHNMSRWLKPWLARPDGIEMDAFVEQIEYDESRDYVKKVSAYYDTYVRLYGPEDARVVVPERPTADDATVVDF